MEFPVIALVQLLVMKVVSSLAPKWFRRMRNGPSDNKKGWGTKLEWINEAFKNSKISQKIFSLQYFMEVVPFEKLQLRIVFFFKLIYLFNSRGVTNPPTFCAWACDHQAVVLSRCLTVSVSPHASPCTVHRLYLRSRHRLVLEEVQ